MTYIQTLMTNLEIIDRLMNALTMEDVSTREGKSMKLVLKRRRARYEDAVKKWKPNE